MNPNATDCFDCPLGRLWEYDGAALLDACGLAADPWQRDFLRLDKKRVAMNCSRQTGKSTVVALKAIHRAITSPPGQPRTILLLSATGRQSKELFQDKVVKHYARLGRPVVVEQENVLSMTLANGSRIVSLPTTADGIVGYSAVDTVIIDEASRVPDELYYAVRPMLAISGGRLILMSTPRGKRGFFYKTWTNEDPAWLRIKKTADDCARIPREFIEEERRAHPPAWFEQEYYCSFESVEGMVYPEFPGAVTAALPSGPCRTFFGNDPGFGAPAAIVTGHLDESDVLWILEEHYKRGMTTEESVSVLQGMHDRLEMERGWVDNAEPRTIETYRRNSIPAVPAYKAVIAGIGAVAHRLRTGRLRVHRSCVNLIHEANGYRYPTEEEKAVAGENPVKGNDHALDALRYMVCGIDRVRYAKPRTPIQEEDRERQAPPPGHPGGDYTRPAPVVAAPPPPLSGAREETEADIADQRDYLRNHAWSTQQ